MFLSEKAIHEKNIIQNAEPDNFYSVGYDLRIKEIICNFLEVQEKSERTSLDMYELNPGATVFVSTEETIEMPLDLVGIVVPKNSIIRSGLQIDSPIYQPGHKTRIFIRVTNISSDMIKLKKGNLIAAIMFSDLDCEAEKYEGKYVNEFVYEGAAKYPGDTIPQLVKVEQKIDEIKDLEDKLLSKVITLVTILFSLFTLINVNINFIQHNSSWNMIVYNIMSVGIIGFLVGFISILVKKISKCSIIAIFLISCGLIIAACIMTKYFIIPVI